MSYKHISIYDHKLPYDCCQARQAPSGELRSALLLATARRLAHDPAHPLPPVRSLYYFLPVLEEIRLQPLPPGYLQYLERKISSSNAPTIQP